MLKSIFLSGVNLYRKGISPFTPPTCRFTPTCSAYAAEAIDRLGVWRGSWLTLKRISRCHPFGGHGYDPVPLSGEGKGEVSGRGGMIPDRPERNSNHREGMPVRELL